MDDIIQHLGEFISDMVNQPWITMSTNYESGFCEMVGWKVENGRYHDAISHTGVRVEIKKGMSGMWFNEVRYSEVILGEIQDSREHTITIYIEYKKNASESMVTRIMVIDTMDLIVYMDISPEWARRCVERHYSLREKGRGINMQQQLSTKQIAGISKFIINRPVVKLDPVTHEQGKINRRIRIEKLRAKRVKSSP